MTLPPATTCLKQTTNQRLDLDPLRQILTRSARA
uniref:Uncharacterized protein n=1 Tax=Anguilla anguilla TaxID=7936 RepID=A0A0E9RHS1_ANGAN